MTKMYLFCLVFCLCNFWIVNCHVFDEKLFLDNLKDNSAIEQLYYPFMNQTLDLIDLILHDPKRTINQECTKNLNQIKVGLLAKEKWSLLYYESNGFPKNGRLNGDYNNLGYFDQCLSIPETEMKNDQIFETKFCLISISTPEWNQLVKDKKFNNYFNPLQESTKEMFKFNFGKIFGTCLPASCNTQSILKSINRLLLPLGLNATSQQYCSTKTSKLNEAFTFTEIISVSIFGCTIALCLLSCFFEENSFLCHFSLRKNFSRVYDYDPNDAKTRSTDYLHGLKALLVAGSIFLHSIGIVFFQSPFLFSKIRYVNAGTYQFLLDRAFLFADQLFFYGGFFCMFSWYESIKKINVTPYRFVFTRFLRIFTVSVMVILLTFLMPLLSSGPYYLDLTRKCTMNCAKNFWKNLLLINNQGSFSEICFLPTWYLAADFQLYLLNYFLIHQLVKNPKTGLILAAIHLIVGSAIVIVYDYYKDIPYYYKLTTNMDSTTTFRLEEHYLPTIYHSNTFVMGILTAWAIKSGLKFKFFENMINLTLASLLSISILLTAMSLPDLWETKLLKKNNVIIIIWSVIDKFLVTSAVSWAFYAISLNYYATLRKAFSLRCWIPISQISFSMIMCQFLYFFYLTGTQKFLYTFELSNIIKEFVFAFSVTFLVSNLTFLFFETPVTNLLLKTFKLNRRRDIKVDNKPEEIKYDYPELNNNNPDFKPLIVKKLD